MCLTELLRKFWLREYIKKQRHHFANKGSYGQSYGFFSSHVQMSELDNKEGWAPKNWCFWIVLLEKTLKSPLDCKIKPVSPKGNQSWIFIARTDAPEAKNWLIGKDRDARKAWRQKGTEDEMVGWHHRLDGHEFEQAPGVGNRQGSLVCCSPYGCSQTQLSDWTETTEKKLILCQTIESCPLPYLSLIPTFSLKYVYFWIMYF